ncbi:Uncharacterised protein [Mycobacteroides abscessus subsp. abscessus]|uniref:SDR family NAD(P)-dependent oxidoreductase n=3 Tax=Mycobacteroides abscessus TaxID=36809 RepID=A0AB33T6S8_9MYCO|nr:hypothetical protein [Mycobacteroides abscessus]AWG48850.1 hypothetical protein DDT48_05170 [Mycobacteroides abscessus]EIC66439.1 hypothetical protein S7W_16408 [Mycobacteroides abscessus M94]MBE5441049.1 hypothetical protein [Mycobacteroides abscessus]MBE5450363.1 hypothetical protein [Mycobacteroides abscessus]MBE5464692.1 hypothetical protein [Mycobacteroides abscessus]
MRLQGLSGVLALADGEAHREPTKVLSTRTSAAGLVEISGIDGKIVAITGTSSGIGETIARLFAERGRLTISGLRVDGRSGGSFSLNLRATFSGTLRGN